VIAVTKQQSQRAYGAVPFLTEQRFRHEQTHASIERAVERRGNEADRLPGLSPWRALSAALLPHISTDQLGWVFAHLE
jgi:hypothetical protein